MENRYYRMQDRVRNRVQYSLKRPYFSLAIVLLFLLVALVAVFRPGYTHTVNNDLTTPLSGNFSPANQAAPLPPVEQKSEVSLVAGESEHTEPAPVKPSPSTQPAGKEEYDSDNPGSGAPALALPDPGTGEYDYSKPVPAADAAITDDYFQDAVFIGDSRTAGFQLFSGPQKATYYTANGLKVDTIFTKEIVETDSGEKITIIEALRQKPFQKVYIMLGINELGWAYSDLFIKKYGEIIAEIKNIAPQARIYVQSLLPVSKKRSQSDEIYNNVNIGKYNELIQQMAAEKKLYYLDVAQCVADPEGNLASDASTDGIHLQKTYCDLWLDYLKRYYVSP
jgi:lysophospholipase L1-like esterase